MKMIREWVSGLWETIVIKYRYPKLYALLRDNRVGWDDEE